MARDTLEGKYGGQVNVYKISTNGVWRDLVEFVNSLAANHAGTKKKQEKNKTKKQKQKQTKKKVWEEEKECESRGNKEVYIFLSISLSLSPSCQEL